MKNDYIAIRRYLHQHPELSFEEYNSAKTISDVLNSLSIPHSTGIAKTGVCGVLRGKYPGKTILLRADMDALPLQEKNQCEYASQNNGVMHACGHDVHVAVILMAAELLSERIDDIHGNVKFVFQPAEETTGGALPMIKEGILKNPDVSACIGLHVKPELETGKIIASSGKIMASPDSFYITLSGKGGHCATPSQNDDLLSALAVLLTELKCISYPDSLVVPCEVHAGTAPNIMPSELKISGSFRSFDPGVRQKIAQNICNLVEKISKSFGIQGETEIELLYPPLCNDTRLTTTLQKVAETVIGTDNVIKTFTPSFLGEDFSYFGEFVPASYFYLGCKRNDRETALHADNFDVDESAIEIGAKIIAETVLEYLK